ncbi:MAG: four helix bundle protein [Kiritimatiellae bacterium]|nr:four helix bundle protein [Kiritimatiellia bacterium]
MNALYSNLPVYRDCYVVALEFAKARGSLSRDTRYTIAQDLSRTLVDMMVTIYRANSSRSDKVRLIAELRRDAVEIQIYFRLLSDMHQLGVQKAAFFMEKVASIGKQLAAWHKSAVKGSRTSNGAEPPSPADGRPECAGSRPGAASHKVNPIRGRAVSPLTVATAAKGDLTENTEVTP